MKKIDTNGLKMTGLKKASGETRKLDNRFNQRFVIMYNRESGEVWTDFLIGCDWKEYHDPAVIEVVAVRNHISMQDIADTIADRLDEIAYWENK